MNEVTEKEILKKQIRKEYDKLYSLNNKQKKKEYYLNNKQNIIIKRTCEHKKGKRYCKICDGSAYCVHNQVKSRCKLCNFNSWLKSLLSDGLKRMFKVSTLKRTKTITNYLGCNIEFFISFINNKMFEDINWNNIHLDHIKPLNSFNLNDEEEFKKCCHYSNYQPLLIADNFKKFNKWDEEANKFWLDNIIYKEYNKIFIP